VENARVDDVERPDLLVFDLDPGEGVAWEFVIDTALTLRRMLKQEGLEPWPKLTGGKGLHLMAPLDRTMDHDQARAYAKRVAQRLAASAPDRYTLASAPGRRAGRIFIDYLRNGRGTTAIGAWSPRARAGFPFRPLCAGARSRTAFVRTPLPWRSRRPDSRLAPRHGAALACRSVRLPAPMERAACAPWQCAPRHAPSTGTGVVTFLMG
jgi:hypothetical protein